MLNEDCPKITGDSLFDPQTLYQENIDQEKSRRRITEQPFFGTNNLPEAPAVSLFIEDLSNFSDMCRRIAIWTGTEKQLHHI